MTLMNNNENRIHKLTSQAYAKGKRLCAPLAGFPGCDLAGISLKVAQQNRNAHFKCLEAIKTKFEPDISFIMMDLSLEANALGMPVSFPVNGPGRVSSHTVKTVSDIEFLRNISFLDDSRIRSYLDVLTMMAKRFDNLNCAYIAGPATLAGLLIGAETAAIESLQRTIFFKEIIDFCCSVILDYTKAIIETGTDLICILEPTGVIFAPQQFKEFSSANVKKIIDLCKLHKVETIYHVCGNSSHLIDSMVETGVSALSLDSPDTGMDLVKIAKEIPEDVVIIGNINPVAVMKDSTSEQVYQTTKKLLNDMQPFPNFILSTGCDLPLETPPENIKAFMKAGKNFC